MKQEKVWKPTVGKKYRIYYGKDNPYNARIHILAIVDKEYYVYKYWWKYKQRWIYEVQPLWWYQMKYRDGSLLKST